MKYLTMAILALTLALGACKSPPPASLPVLTQVPPDTRTVRQVSINKAAAFHAKVHGYVWGPGWSCPPCPPDVVCGTCPDPVVTFGDTKTRPDAPARGTSIYALKVHFDSPPGEAIKTGDHLWVEGDVSFEDGERRLVATRVSRLP